MDKILIHYSGDNDASRVLEYTLRNNSTTDKFLSVWQYISQSKSTVESDIEWHIPSYDEQYYTNLIYSICQALESRHGVELPPGWQTPPYSSDYLNVLHEGFRVNQNDSTNSAYSDLLHDLNLNIHQLEGFIYAEQAGDVNPVIHSFMDFANSYKFDFEETDASLLDTNYRNRHCIFMAYETLGKTLESVVIDNDLAILDNGVLMPKTKIGSQFSVCVPWSNFSDHQMLQLNQSYCNQITDWCNQNNILEQYNVDHTHWLHQPGRVILADGHTTQSDWQWFVDQDNVILESVEFQTSKFNLLISLLMDSVYEINKNISGQ